jgi:flagellar hook-associated protein FlgK
MTDLMEYQKAYEASAQLVTTLDSMMETVIDMKPATDS